MLRSSCTQLGASIIEVLVAILIISFGMLAMAAVQTNAVKFNKTAEYRSTAVLLAADIADRMRANSGAAKTDGYRWATTQYSAISSNAVGTSASCGSVTNNTINGCSASDMAVNDLVIWRTRLLNTLPGATGHIGPVSADGSGIDLWIAWSDPDETDRNGTAIGQTSPECPSSSIWQVSTAIYHCLYMRVSL